MKTVKSILFIAVLLLVSCMPHAEQGHLAVDDSLYFDTIAFLDKELTRGGLQSLEEVVEVSDSSRVNTLLKMVDAEIHDRMKQGSPSLVTDYARAVRAFLDLHGSRLKDLRAGRVLVEDISHTVDSLLKSVEVKVTPVVVIPPDSLPEDSL